jgi:hypothetical protein
MLFKLSVLWLFLCDTTIILCACCKKASIGGGSHNQCAQPLLCNVRIITYQLSTNSNCQLCSLHTSAMLNCEHSPAIKQLTIQYEIVDFEVSW